MSGNILSLEQITDNAVGGKAYGLSRLLAMGLPVPPAFVIRGARAGSYPDDLDAAISRPGLRQGGRAFLCAG